MVEELSAMNDESKLYKDVLNRELVLFQTKYCVSYEALAFPHLFFMGGFFDSCPPPGRFKEYRSHLMHQYTGQFENDADWSAWSKACENYLEKALIEQLVSERIAQL